MGEACCGSQATCHSATEPPEAAPESCCASGSCEKNTCPREETASNLCLAVVPENGGDVVVYDARGQSRSFGWLGRGDTRKLCFSSHGAGDGVDEIMTQCFDANGCHGPSPVPCFCGVDQPHLHAHIKNSKACATKEIGLLASQILYPKQVGTQIPVPVSQTEMGVDESIKVHEAGKDSQHRRVHKVNHGDHTDYLVHDEKTGELRLENPCHECGHGDVHGTFRNLSQRRLYGRERSVSGLHFHFFEVGPRCSVPHKCETKPLCLAVVRENGADIVVFDASGRAKTFNYFGDIRQLCFNTHGAHSSDLTPCFDGKGNHGVPDNLCFCGVDTPHLHAHIKDPQSCMAPDASHRKDLGYLASQILYPNEDTDSTEDMAQIDLTENTPKQCNAEAFKMHRDRESEENRNRMYLRRRMHKVQHDDHFDYLVHNARTGQLQLEHPCNDCGDNDVHGSFLNVAQRQLSLKSGDELQMHFFEVAPRPQSLLEVIHGLFQVDSDRVKAIDQIRQPARSPTKRVSLPPKGADEGPKIVRSTFVCKNICCSAEIPIVNSILNPVKGVEGVKINAPLKQVLVDHDIRIISASQIADVLSKNHFGGTVTRDGGAAELAVEAVKTETGRSAFYVDHICCASEIPMINSVLEPLKGVNAISVNTTTKTVYVDHTLGLITAQDICDALNHEAFGAEIRRDAGATAVTSATSFVRSMLSFEHDDPETEGLTSFLQTYDATTMESFVVDVPEKTIAVVHNPFFLSAKAISEALQAKTGIKSMVTSDGADPSSWKIAEFDESAEELEKDENFAWPRPTVILSGVFWIISMLSYIGGNWGYLKWVGLVAVIFGLPPIAIKAFRTMRRFQFDANCLMLFASIGAVALQEFQEAAAVVFLFAISEWLEVRASSRARHALAAIVSLRPEKANIFHPSTKEIIVVPAAAVPVGALVSVKPGDKIPCDGVVVEGTSTVDESSLTGESRPISKGPGDEVSGGTVNSGLTPLTVRTTSTSENSAVSRLIRLVEEAQANTSDTEKLIDEFAKWYTPVIVLAAILMVSIPWAFGPELGREWTNNGLILIVVACPCALIISTPVSYVAGLAATAQKGVLIKGGAVLEKIGIVKNICFDKTGTLTNGEFALLYLEVTHEGTTREETFQYLSLMEERASHPMAQALMKGAINEKVEIPVSLVLEDHAIVNGEGVVGRINGLDVHVGNERMFTRLGLLENLPKSKLELVDGWKHYGGTIGFMSIEGRGIVCAFCCADKVRDESAAVVGRLKRQGIDVQMLTGDNRDAAIAIGEQVGLTPDEVKSKLLPEEKLRHVEDLSSDGNVSLLCNPCSKRKLILMVGDGVNDAPALASADVGVAMGAGAALAMETADVTLLDSNLEKLEYSINMGRRVIAKIKQNVVFSVTVKFVVLGFALAGKTNLWAAIGSDVGAMILVTLNAMLLLPARQRNADVVALKGDIEKATSLHVGMARKEGAPPAKEDDDGHSHEHGDSCGGRDHGHSHAKAPKPTTADDRGHNNEHGGGCGGHEHEHDKSAKAPELNDDQSQSHQHCGCCGGHDVGHEHDNSAKAPEPKEADDLGHEHGGSCCGQDHGHAHADRSAKAPEQKGDLGLSHEHGGSCGVHDHGHSHAKASEPKTADNHGHRHEHGDAHADKSTRTPEPNKADEHSHSHVDGGTCGGQDHGHAHDQPHSNATGEHEHSHGHGECVFDHPFQADEEEEVVFDDDPKSFDVV